MINKIKIYVFQAFAGLSDIAANYSDTMNEADLVRKKFVLATFGQFKARIKK